MHLADQLFYECLKSLQRSEEIKAYVASVFNKFVISTHDDMSSESVTLEFINAKRSGDFAKFQRLGDWSLWILTFSPHFKDHDVVETFGRISYAKCNSILKYQWKIYEELADELPVITREIRGNMFKIIPKL